MTVPNEVFTSLLLLTTDGEKKAATGAGADFNPEFVSSQYPDLSTASFQYVTVSKKRGAFCTKLAFMLSL